MKIEFSPIEVTRVYASDYQKKNTMTAELKQLVTTTYPGASISNGLNDALFSDEAFNLPEGQSFTSTRIGWINVPEGTTLEVVKAKLAQTPNAKLTRILSNNPILSKEDQYAIDSPDYEATMDTFADRQVVRDGESQSLILDANGKVQFKKIVFKLAGNDQDLRTPELEDQYWSPEIEQEYLGSEVAANDQVI